ncbi:MAG: hypothetical protein J2P21_00530, partial [Chloracidobacterium sp.]|nr:hypothetical protein [Chloracidobacterium sp.]
SSWPESAKRLWKGNVMMREAGLRELCRELSRSGITVPALEQWDEEYYRLFKNSRRFATWKSSWSTPARTSIETCLTAWPINVA